MLGVGGLIAGVYWVIGRRMKLAAEQAAVDEGTALSDTTEHDGDSDHE